MPDIDSLSGRELDAAVAEKVMGWTLRRFSNGGGEWLDVNGKHMASYDVPHRFSSDWSAAALLIERMWASGEYAEIEPRLQAIYHGEEPLATCHICERGWTNDHGIYVAAVKIEDPAKAMVALATAVCRAAMKARDKKQ